MKNTGDLSTATIDVATFLRTIGVDPDETVFESTKISFEGTGPNAVPFIRWEGFKVISHGELMVALELAREANENRREEAEQERMKT